MIHVNQYLPSTITSRHAIKKLFEEALNEDKKTIDIDFSDIEFISRAAADELIHFIDSNKKNVNIVNANKVVAEIISVVQKNRDNRKLKFHNIAVTPFTSDKELEQFLSMI